MKPQLVDDPSKVDIQCVELNSSNYANLQDEISKLTNLHVTIEATCGEFARITDSRAEELLAMRNSATPTFWTADPYGFKGVPLATIEKLMSIPRPRSCSPSWFGICAASLNRRTSNEFSAAIHGVNASTPGTRRNAKSLLLRYSELIRSGIARFATPFRVFEDERKQTLYYLVDLSNHALGMREMKKAMVRESPDMTFWPVTVRPPDQLELDISEQAPFPRLQTHLATTHGERRLTFDDLLNDDYPRGLWLEPEYRAALLDMEGNERVDVERNRTTPSGQKPRGLKGPDTLTFPAPQLTLG